MSSDELESATLARQFDKAVAGLTEQAESGKGFNWLQLSAEQDNPIALRELGFLHENGKGVALSMSEATRLISKAASLGDKKSIEWVDTHYPDKPNWLKTLCLDSASKE